MLNNLETYNWDQVMGENVVAIASGMLWQPIKLLRSTRLHSEGRRGKARMMYVTHDINFVQWRLMLLLKDCDDADIPMIKQVFDAVIDKLRDDAKSTPTTTPTTAPTDYYPDW
jgi:uncharacterized protein YjaG (DUF416 family)